MSRVFQIWAAVGDVDSCHFEENYTCSEASEEYLTQIGKLRVNEAMFTIPPIQ